MMFRRMLLTASVGVAVLACGPAEATLRLSAGGTINNIYADIGGDPQEPPRGAFGVGDAWSLVIDFDPINSLQARETALSTSNGTYFNFGANILFTAGTYTRAFTTVYGGDFLRLRFGNNQDFGIPELSTVDSQVFDALDFDVPGEDQPFDFGSGAGFFSVGLDMYDSTGLTRSSKRVTEVADPNGFEIKSFFFTSGRAEDLGDRLVFADVYGDGAVTYSNLTQLAAVPEPATWALMIVGFGLTGGMMRRRKTSAQSPRRLSAVAVMPDRPGAEGAMGEVAGA